MAKIILSEEDMSVINFGIKRPDDFVPISDEILEKTIIPQFEMMVEKYPEKTAIKSALHTITYRELNNAINNLAYQIIDLMGGDKSPVAFLHSDEVFSVITFMAIIKSGRPYVGLHPSNSAEQIKSYIEDSTASLLITTIDFKEIVSNSLTESNSIKFFYMDRINADSNSTNPNICCDPNDIFGIFYTSGSTGKPKGIAQGHLYKSQSALYMTNEWFVSPSDRIALVTSVCYGASYPSILCALLNGALLWIYDIKSNSGQKALDWIENEKLTIFRSTPSIFRSIFSNAPKGLTYSKLRFMTLGGEPVSDSDIELFKAHTAKDCVLINNFSASESGTICHFPVNHNTPPFNGFLPAGFQAPGKEVFILDEHGREVQSGSVGEIVVRSRYLSLGYWRNPELTAQKFFTDQNDPKFRIYHTGDRGFWQKNGALVTIGREDSQVKIRGFRVQLEAIDLALRNLENVKDAATLVHKSSGSGQKLVAYLSLFDKEQFLTSKMKQALSMQLPDYMIPSLFILLDMLPRTASGKLARLELPEPSMKRPNLETPYIPPSNELEEQIASIWQGNLGMDQIGINDNFFELGGDSLSALVMTLEVEKLLNRTIPKTFFKNPTISFLAGQLESDNQTRMNNDFFILESFDKSTRSSFIKTSRRFNASILKELIFRKFSVEDISRIIDRLVANYILSKPYFYAKKWIVGWSQIAIVQKLLYKGRYTKLLKLVASLPGHCSLTTELFQRSIITNLSYIGLSRYYDKRNIDNIASLSIIKGSRFKYWQSLAELIEKTPEEDLPHYFPITGLEYLLNAIKEGRGVILLTGHSITSPIRLYSLSRQIKMEIPTISYHIPIRQSQYHKNPNELPNSIGSTMNAEIALFAQKLLQQGQIINIVGDTKDPYGTSFHVSLGGRAHQVKSGFAELALNTGAKIIPHFGGCLADGSPEQNLLPPLEPGDGDRDQQIENLVNQYVSFVHSVWTKHPEVIHWGRINDHFSRPEL